MNISSITSKVVEYGIKKPVNALNSSSLAKRVCTEYKKDNAKFIGSLAIASIALKDGLGCVMYVNQSLNNKKIPEDKRKFVAALDLTNGGLMILSQILMYKTISSKKCQEVMFNKVFGKLFNAKAAEKLKAVIKPKNEKHFDEIFNGKFKSKITGFFGIFTSLVASTIIAKRVLVPFVATPLADKAKGLLGKSDEKKAEEPKAEESKEK